MSSTKSRILVVDDTDAARYWAVRTLRADGYETIEAKCGRQALELARREKPELILLDVRLPDILGFEVTEQLRSDEATKSIAILQMSASFTAADAQAHGLQRGADSYLTTPVEPQVLVATVHSLLRMRAAEQAAQSERQRAEQALRVAQEQRERAEASESYYRFLADMVPQLVWSADAHGQPDYFNRRWAEFAGDGSNTAVTMDWVQTLHADDRDEFVRRWAHSLRTGEPLEIECRRFSPPARAFRWLLIRAMPMRGPDGAIVRWFGTSTDIESQKQAISERERLLEEARRNAVERDALVAKLQEESQRKNEFLAILSHELRNPLAPIRNSVYILERAVPGSEQAQRARDIIDRQVQHMSRLVDDLLDVTRIARGKIRLQKASVELAGLVRRSAEDLRSLFRRSDVQLDIQVPEQPLLVNGDATRLAQVVGNLLQNSAKFTAAGGRVTVSLRAGDNDAAISVRDTGAGISEENLAHLFQPFVQGERTLDRSAGGLGLGLALAKGIVELHEGNISARSDGPGKGSEFTVKLPLAKVPSDRLSSGTSEHVLKQPRRVLIIEDMRDAGESLREVLQLSGHIVEIAEDGPSGVALAHDFHPDVVLCDIGLPGMNGYGVARQMRTDPKLRDTFLVALSGYALQEDIERSKDAGFDRHMPKPPRLDDLETILVQAPRRTEASP